MARLTEVQFQELARHFARSMDHHAPGWTDHASHDPGVTLLQIFAYLGEELVSRQTQLPERSQSSIEHAIAALSALRWPENSAQPNATRVRFFGGQLLGVDDLQAEQNYGRTKHRLHNRWLHGVGIVSGLTVTVDAASSHSSPVVSVSDGVAIAPDGELLVVQEPCTRMLHAPCSNGFVTLRYVERLVAPVPIIGETESEASRIEESVALAFDEVVPHDRVAIARLVRTDGSWQVAAADAPLRNR